MTDQSPPRRPAGRFLRMEHVIAEVGLSKATINRLHRRGDFPPKVQITSRSTGWWEGDIVAWKADRRDAPRTG